MKTRLVEFLRALLPDGVFWRMTATERYLQALAAAVEPLAQSVQDLAREIVPSTAGRDVLLQWWESVRSQCVGTPIDTEELREKVIAALGASPGHTPAGLQSLLDAALTSVEMSESLPVSNVPGDVPMDVEPTGRIIELWHMPLIDHAETVRCVARGYAPAGDELRIVAPDATFQTVGELANQQALAWKFARDPMDLVIRRVAGSDGAQTDTTVELQDETSLATIASLLSLAGSTNLAEDWLAWHFERDGVDATRQRHSREAEVAAFKAATGWTPSYMFFGRRTGMGGEHLGLEGAASTVAATGLVGLLGTRAYNFTGADGAAFAGGNVGDISDDTSIAIVVLVRVRTFPSVTSVAVGKQDSASTFTGWNLFLRPDASNQVWSFRLDPNPGSFVHVPLTATSNNLNEWRALVAIVDRKNGDVRFASDLESGTTIPAVTGLSIPSIPLRIGDSRPVALGTPIDGEVHLVAICEGAQVENSNPQSKALALRSALAL
jgi:hypothetical protein